MLLCFRYYDGCPLSCRHCSISANAHKPIRSKLSASEVYNFATKLSYYENLDIVMSGSEVLIDCEDFCELSNRLILYIGAKIGLITSGYWAKSEHGRQSGLMYLSRCGISSVRLSIDAFHKFDTKSEWLTPLVQGLKKRSIEVFVNEAVEPGNRPMFQRSVMEAGVDTENYTAFSASYAGRMTDYPPTTNIPEVPYLGCDFGKVAYLSSDGGIFGCSGPGNATCRKLGTVRNPSKWQKRLIEVESQVSQFRQSLKGKLACDTCFECNKYFAGRV